MLKGKSIPPERWLYTAPLRLRALFRRRQLDQDLDEELRSHLEEQTQGYIELGLSAEDAHYAALRDFGNLELAKQNCRDARRVLWVQNLIEDLHFGLRTLRKAPAFTAVAMLTLALGIGANTAIFSVINTVLLRPLPYAQPERLVFLSESAPDIPVMFLSLANFADWQSMNTVFENMGGYRRVSATLAGQGSEPQRLVLGQVTSGLFPTLGVEPVLGHAFTPEEDKPDTAPVVLLSDTLWARQFGRDPNVLGKQLRLDGTWYTVTGVIRNDLLPLYWRQIDAFTSLGRLENAIGGEAHRTHHLGVYAYARLKPGITLEQARADMLSISQRLAQRHPQTNAGQGAVVQPLLQKVVGEVSRPLAMLMGAVALVLLIACANVASLLISRAIVRRREIAIRSALGAGTARLVGQLLCESTLLALAGGALGLLAAYCVTPVLARRAIAIVPRIEDISIDRSVLIFTFAVSLATGIVFGVVPALAIYRRNPTEAFQETGGAPRSGFLPTCLRSMLATAELAMALVLLVGAGLTIKSLFLVLQTDSGMQTNGVLTGVLNLPGTKYKTHAEVDSFMRRLMQKIAPLPGVTAAGFETPQLIGGSQGTFRVEGRPQPQQGRETYAEFSSLTPGTLEALGVKLFAGRFFQWKDDAEAPRVCIIDDALAEQYWPGENAIGKRIATEVPVTPTWWRVAGVVHHLTTDGAAPHQLVEIFFPYSQFPDGHGRLIIQSQQGRASPLPEVIQVIHSLDPDLPLYDVRTLSDLMEDNVATRRLLVVLLSVFAALALLLAMPGVYGVIAYMVTARTREIGVRLALGAKRRDILRLVLAQLLPVIVGGAGLGILACLALRRSLGILLFHVSAADPWTIAGSASLLIAVALAACWIPLRKAMTIDPVRVLHRE
ncbi:MAG: ADOP family duplicated permease [Candidatus Korobacteraceae bacterium]